MVMTKYMTAENSRIILNFKFKYFFEFVCNAPQFQGGHTHQFSI